MMPIIVSKKEVEKQSNQVFNQFGNKWKLFASMNSKLTHENVHDLRNSGIGKFLVLAAMGESLEENVGFIKKYRDKIDVMTCDKGFGPLLERGVKADYVMICDCNILYKWIKPWINKTDGVKLLSTLYASPRWTHRWRGPRYYFVNKDAIQSQDIFNAYLKPKEIRNIPAGSNVSNAMLVFWTGSDELQNINWGGYEKYLLVGYDYSWRHRGNYYAWNNPKPKRYYMNHKTIRDMVGDLCFTSENLMFSAKWAYSYITSHGLPVVNCSGRGLLDIQQNNLENELKSISSNKDTAKETIKLFDLAKKAKEAYDLAASNFHNSRRHLYARV